MHLLPWFQNNSNATIDRLNNLAAENIANKDGTQRYFVPAGLNRILWGAALGVTLTRAQVVTPSLQQLRANVELRPYRKGAVALTLGFPEVWRPFRPVPVVPGEDIEFQIAQGSGGAEDEYGFVELGTDQLPAIPDGPLIVVRATGTTTLTAKTWSTVALTLDSSLPVGTYALVGFIASGATAIVARAILPGQNYRPGLPALAGTESAAADANVNGLMPLMSYNMGTFPQNLIPQFEYFAAAADTAQTVIMFLVRVGQ